jgi:DNA-directed RNA polymerase subunit N (RpoN/RPB10)
MGFFKNLFSPPSTAGTFYQFSVKCKRCGETIQGRINVNNEPGTELDEKGKTYFTCRKVLIGSGHCFQQIEIVINFDNDRHVLDRKIRGGEFIDD